MLLITLRSNAIDAIATGRKLAEFGRRTPKVQPPFAVLAHRKGSQDASLVFVVESIAERGVWTIQRDSARLVEPIPLGAILRANGTPVKAWPQEFTYIRHINHKDKE